MSETLSLRERIQALPDGHRLVWYPATHQLNTTTDELKALVAALDAAEQRERVAVGVLKDVREYILLVHREVLNVANFNRPVYDAGHATMNKVEAAIKAAED
jgi:hypothetical protein